MTAALVRSEWTKLVSLRSTWWCAAIYLVVTGGLGWLMAATTSAAGQADTAVRVGLIGFGFGQFAVLVLAVLVGAGEFASGMVLASLTSVPHRVRWLAAKTAVLTGAVAVLTAVLVLVSWLAARTMTATPGGITLTAPGVPRALLLQLGCAVLTAVLALALGVLLRSTAGGVSAGAALVFWLPVLLPLFGTQGQWLSEAMPVLRVGGDPFLVAGSSWPVGLAVSGGWAAGAWALAAVLLVRRDV